MEIEAVEKIFQKKSKKSEPFGAFLERYLFGWIGNKFQCREGNNWKNGKKIKNSAAIFRIFGKILVRDDPGKIQASGKKNQKKSEKIRRFPNFSGRYLIRAHRAFYRIPERKIEKNPQKSDHLRFFVEDT